MKKVLLTVAALAVVAGVAYASMTPDQTAATATTATGLDQSEVQALIADRHTETLLAQYETALEDARQALSKVQNLSDQVGAIAYSDVEVPIFDPMFMYQLGLNDIAFGVHEARTDLADAITQKSPAVVAAADLQMHPQTIDVQATVAGPPPCVQTLNTKTASTCSNKQD